MNYEEIISLTDCEDILYELSQHQLLLDVARQKFDWLYGDCSEKVRKELSDIGYFMDSYRDVDVRGKLATVIEAISKAKKQSVQGSLDRLSYE
jgi:hypothetical protein